MNKSLKITICIVIATFAIVLLLLGLFIFKPKLFESPIQTLIYEQTGYIISTDTIEIQLSPTLVKITDFALENPEWEINKTLLVSKQVEVTLDVMEMLSRDGPFWSAKLNQTEMRFDEDNNGGNNWLTTRLDNKPASNRAVNFKNYFSFNDIHLSNTNLLYTKPAEDELIKIIELEINNISDEKITLTGTGSYQQQNIKINGSADIAQLKNDSNNITFLLSADGMGIESNTKGKLNLDNLITSTFSSNVHADSLKQLEILLEEKLPNITPIDITVDLSSSEDNVFDFNAKGQIQNQNINFKGQVSASNQADKSYKYSLSGNGLGVEIDSDGIINSETMLHSNLNAQLKTNSLKQIETLLEQELPEIAPLNINFIVSKLKSDEVQLKIEGLAHDDVIDIQAQFNTGNLESKKTPVDIQFSAFGIDATAKGTADLKSFNAADLNINAKAESLEKLESLLATTLPDVTPLDASLHLKFDENLYQVENLNLKAGQNSLQGSARYQQKENKLNADLMGDQLNLTPYLDSKQDDEEVKSTSGGPQNATSENELEWLQKLDSNIKFTANTLIANEHKLKDLNVELNTNNGTVVITKLVSRYQRQVEGKTDTSLTLPLSIAGTVTLPSADSEKQLINLDVTLNDGDMDVSVAGSLAYAENASGTLKIKGQVSKFESLSSYLEYDMRPFAPATLDITADVTKDSIDFKPILLEISGDDLHGQGTVDWSGEKLAVKATLKSKKIDLNNFSPLEQAAEEIESDVDDSRKYVFSKEPIDWTWLELVDLDLKLDLNKFVINKKTEFKKVDAQVVLKDGKLIVDPFDGNLSEGGLRGSLTLEKRNKNASIKTNFVGLNITPADLGEKDKGIIDGGNTDIEVNATLAGASAHELAASLNGELVLEIQNAKMRNDLFERFGSDIFLETLSMINPFIKKDTYTDLDCAAVRFTAKDGELVSNNQIAIETSKMKIVAGGIVNLSTEELEIGFTPIAKKGLGVNVSNLVKFVRLGGTLSNPSPEADPAGILKSGAAIGAAISTGGLSLLVDSLFKRVTNAGTACNHIFEEEAEVPDALEERAIEEKQN